MFYKEYAVMKRSLVLSVCCLLLAMAAPVFATVVPCTTSVMIGNITADATWTENWGTLGGSAVDLVEIYLTGVTGSEAAHTILDIQGLLQTDSQFYVYNKAATVASFKSHTAVNLDTGAYINLYSVVNFDSTTGVFARQSGTDATYWSNIISGTWYNNGDATENWVPAAIGAGVDNDGDGVVENLMLSLFVKSGATYVQFGDGTANSQVGYSVTGNVYDTELKVSKVPEPSTLALLGCGLFGLLAYAWRKRK
jgi:hypothetical protein